MTIDPDGPPEELRSFASKTYGADQTWSALSGGRSNRSWRLLSGGESWVFKLFDPERANHLFPNDPTAEIIALKALGGTGLAPDFENSFVADAGVCLIYRYVVGRPTPQTDAGTIRLLANLHGVAAPKLRHLEINPKALLRDGQKFLERIATDRAKRLSKCAPGLKDVPSGPNVFLHGDPVPANVLADGDTRCMIDWQCPATGDATADLAIALSPAMHVVYGAGALTSSQEREALLAYPDADVIERYLALKPFYHWRMAAYCAWKAAHGEAVYENAFEAELSRI
ncbi:aminoglycoside phosphotransferase family protein [Celeribacter sp. PS-C1]|uniref:aminoglycoside phosphotransferase family protein n=1 Tax=Celeribacter sp. PS-C1 TaxID=2820813 RepID=UPI001C678C60|nr:aminoglycoside phosphotransferase family protein [Celeribacter sp. PS-C1]MBW6416208.1 aminoglycoside phosphotransferase family protein [Celeribacter sp. PS-C1]